MIRIENISTHDYGYYECLTRKPSLMPYKLSIFLMNFYNYSYLFPSILKKREKVNYSPYQTQLISINQESPNSPCQTPGNAIHKGTHEVVPNILDIKTSPTNFRMRFYDRPGLYQCLVLRHKNHLHIFSNYQMTHKGFNLATFKRERNISHFPERYRRRKSMILKRRSLDEQTTVGCHRLSCKICDPCHHIFADSRF